VTKKTEKRDPIARLGPLLFIVVAILLFEFFWWFVRA
jgi:hypothetical protein